METEPSRTTKPNIRNYRKPYLFTEKAICRAHCGTGACISFSVDPMRVLADQPIRNALEVAALHDIISKLNTIIYRKRITNSFD